MIDIATGEVVLDDGRRVGPRSRASVLASEFPDASVTFAAQRMRLGTVTIDSTEFYMALVGTGRKRVYAVGLQLAMPGDDGGRATWSAAKERQRLELQRSWLSQRGIAPGTHSWGVVDNSYHEADGYSSITLVYRRAKFKNLNHPAPRGLDSFRPDALNSGRRKAWLIGSIASVVAVGVLALLVRSDGASSTVQFAVPGLIAVGFGVGKIRRGGTRGATAGIATRLADAPPSDGET